MKYEFTKEQLDQLGIMLGELPFKHAEPILRFLHSICGPQTEEQLKKDKKVD